MIKFHRELQNLMKVKESVSWNTWCFSSLCFEQLSDFSLTLYFDSIFLIWRNKKRALFYVLKESLLISCLHTNIKIDHCFITQRATTHFLAGYTPSDSIVDFFINNGHKLDSVKGTVPPSSGARISRLTQGPLMSSCKHFMKFNS